MPRYSDRYGDRYSGRHSSSSNRLYVGHLSSRTRTHDLEDIFDRYGRVRDVDMKRDYAFVEFSDPRDADDARHGLNGRDIDGSRIIVEFARGEPRGPGGSRDLGGRGGPPPGSGRCFNCGLDGHWARDCKAGDWKNKCYRCGERGHIERNCQNSPKKLKRGRSYSRSPSPRTRSPSPRRGRSRSRSFSRSRSYSQSPAMKDILDSPRASRSPKRQRGSPVASRGRQHSLSPDERSPQSRGSLSPRDKKRANGSDYGDSPRPRSRGHRSRSRTPRPSRSPRSRSRTPRPSRSPRPRSRTPGPASRSPMDDAERASPRDGDARSPYEENGIDRVGSPIAQNDDDYEASPGGSE